MSQAPPPPPPPQAPGYPPPARPQPPIVYAMPPRGPGFFRTLFASLLRFILVLIVIFIIFALLVAVIQTALMSGEGPKVAVYRDGDTSRQVAIIELEGGIDASAAEFVRGAVQYVLDTNEIQAVVFRVDSGGGGITASDHIWYEMERLKNEGYDVVASYGSVSASGGVYVSCGSDYIFAEPTTVTGSIGVIAQVLTFGDLLEKVGVEPVTLVAEGSPDKAVANDSYRRWDDADKAKLAKILNAGYDTFFDRVWQGRQHVIENEEALRAVADGSIFTADEALDHKLIDAIGYLDDAVDYTIQKAALPSDARVVRLQPWSRGLELPFGLSWHASAGSQKPAGSNAPQIGLDPETVRLWIHELTRPHAMYLWP